MANEAFQKPGATVVDTSAVVVVVVMIKLPAMFLGRWRRIQTYMVI